MPIRSLFVLNVKLILKGLNFIQENVKYLFVGICLTALVFSLAIKAFNTNGPGWASGSAVFRTTAFSNTGSNLTNPQLITAFNEALGAWSNLSAFDYTATNGSADPCLVPIGNAANNLNGYTFLNFACYDENDDPVAFGSTTLAVAITWRSGGTSEIIQSGIVFNSTKDWDIYTGPQGFSTTVDFTRVAIHELGHSLGLAHSADNTAIMWPVASDIETPQNDDLDGVESLYGIFDSDGDGVAQHNDNCPLISNASQADINNDGEGDACDNTDADSHLDNIDNCPLVDNEDQAETGLGVGAGDACDQDDDGVRDNIDNCPVDSNPTQSDLDGDAIGDACDDVNDEFCLPIKAVNNQIAVICL